MDAQQDYPKGNRELQNIIRAEGISAELEDKIMVETGNRTIKQKPALQHILNGVKNIAMNQVTECELQVCNMRIVFCESHSFFLLC